MSEKELENCLKQYHDIYLNKSLLELRAIKSLKIMDQVVEITIQLPYPHHLVENELTRDLTSYLRRFTEKVIKIHWSHQIDTHVGKKSINSLPNVKNLIAVASGKGGVGKSTIALNLARFLAQAGAQVGLADADIYGPSQPTMLGTVNQKAEIEQKILRPFWVDGLQTMSMGYLISPNTPMIWRGPMIAKALEQLIFETSWEDLDYLVVDLPPGTGDIQLTLCQKMPLTGVIIVTTPQVAALADVTRAIEAFIKLEIPILGIVENMSDYTCKHCGHHEAIFAKGGGEKMAQQYNLPLLCQLPLNSYVRETTDKGIPINEENDIQQKLILLAQQTAVKVALMEKDFTHKFPKIVVEK